jgi:uncharacterized Tic20 family protein
MTEGNAPQPLNYQPPGGVEENKDARNMAMLIYILAIFTGFVGPLIIWLLKKNEQPFVDDQGKEVLNWSITVFLAFICCAILMVVLIGVFLMPIVAIANLVFLIMGALKAKDGIRYRFPFALRLIK